MQTIYYVQGFMRGPDGPEPAQLLLRGREGDARWAAELLAQRYAGVLAWCQDQDYEHGYYSEPRVLVRTGNAPDVVDFGA